MSDPLASTFRHLTAVLSHTQPFEPTPCQLAATEALLSGRRVVLRAPAGSGKSLAGWFPWLIGRLFAYDFPTQLLHVLPGGTSFTDLAARLHALTRNLDGCRIGVQTEGEAFDPFLLRDATFTSADELLSMALHHPLGLHPGLSNINAGALLSAYLFFDEFPALAAGEALGLWVDLLRRYYPRTPCLFSSAVLPRPLLRALAAGLDADYLEAEGEQPGGRRIWMTLPVTAAESLLRQHRGRTIFVCNTVRGAQTLNRTLARALGPAQTAEELILLHQHQLYRHRKAQFERAAAVFGPHGAGTGILVTTSSIEAGADFSAETLITDPVAPDRLLLRAARCGRFTGETGRVIVTRVSEYAPAEHYPTPPWQALVERLADDTPHSATEELAVHDALWEAHVSSEQKAACCVMPATEERTAQLDRILTGDEPPARLFSRVSVALHLVPETVQDPFELERFSLTIGSLERGWRQWQAGGAPGEWFALTPEWPREGQQSPTWAPVTDPKQFSAASRLIVLNADAVSYDRVIGLELSPGAPYQSERLEEQHTTWSPFEQHVQTYEEHAARTLEAYEQMIRRYRYALRHLGRHWRIPSVELEQWLRLCVLWHDAGKLTADWQRCAHRWQEGVIRRPAPGVLARIDFRWSRDEQFPCASHAAQSSRVLARALGVLLANHPAQLQGTLAAISHHHGLAQAEALDMTPHPDAWAVLLELGAKVLDDRQLRRLDRVGWAMSLRGQGELPATPPSAPDAWMAYSLLSRIIRLADREVTLDELLA